MCMIIDTDVASDVFSNTSKTYGALHNALFGGRKSSVRIVYGGDKLIDEYERIGKKFRRLLLTLDKKGMARKEAAGKINQKEDDFRKNPQCRSNDQHILALAWVSKVRLLCTDDTDLMQDFKDIKFLWPKGSIYNSQHHQQLISRHCKPKKR